MNYVLVSVIAILGAEYVFQVPLLSRLNLLTTITKKSLAVVYSSRISDHWKEMVLLRYARDILGCVGSIVLMFLGLGSLVALFVILVDCFLELSPTVLELLSSVEGIVVVTIISLVYLIVRGRFI